MVGGGLGHHVLIALRRHSERDDFGSFGVFFNVLPMIVGLFFPEFSKPIWVVLGISSMCIEEGICILPSCLTLVSLRIIMR